jgi:hypothetical protein
MSGSDVPEYLDLFASKLGWAKTDAKTSTPLKIESFANFTGDVPNGMDMSDTDISGNNLVKNRKSMLNDPTADFSEKVLNPFGYGYVPSLNEARIQDAKEIQTQEGTMFALGAITGVSLIVLGLVAMSSSDVSPTIPE